MVGETGRLGRRSSLASLAAVAFGALALASAAPASAGTLDQQQTESDSSFDFGTCPPSICTVERQIALAQTFTAGLAGLLDRVDLVLRGSAGAPPLTVEIRTVAADGCPSTTVLASEEVAAADVPTDFGVVAIPFLAPAAVVAGARYAIVLYTEPGPPLPYDVRGKTSSDPYVRGQLCQSSTAPPSSAPPTSWNGGFGTDLVFKTYVLVAPPGPTAAAFTCMGKHATIPGTPGDDVLLGTNGPDVIVALGGDDKLKGFGGKDLLCGGEGADTIKGANGADRIFGEDGPDRLFGGAGKDALRGGSGKDEIYGRGNSDDLKGNRGDDKLGGGGGNDVLRGNKGADKLFGQGGKDLCKGGAKADKAKTCEVEKSI